MNEEWIKVNKIIETQNLANEITDNIIKNWEELLNSYNIKYKFDIEESTRYFQGPRGKYLDKVYIMYLYTVKEDIQRTKQIISDFENAKSEIPDELKEIEEDDDTEIKPIRVFNYFFSILVILLIILEISIMIITKDDINNKVVYIIMAVIIISELYSIYYINKRKRKKNNE